MDFDTVMSHILNYEGGARLVRDSGGLTKYGISQRAYPGLNIRALTEHEAINLYRRDYWNRIGASTAPANLRLALMDSAVNEGVGKAQSLYRQSDGDYDKFMELRRQHYENLAAANPRDRKYLKGWINRLNRVDHDTSSAASAGTAPLGFASIPSGPEEPKPLYASNIALAAGTTGVVGVTQTVTADPSFQDILLQLVHNPHFWYAVGFIGLVAFILYHRWRDHGRGQYV